MTKNGARLTGRKPQRKFHRYFGSTLFIPDFNIDAGLQMPDQDVDLAFTECTGYAPTDTAADITKKIYSPDWNYGMTLRLGNMQPTTAGADPLTAMQIGVAQGLVESAKVPFSAKTEGELYCANWKNWDAYSFLYADAHANVMNDVHNMLGNGTPFWSVLSAVYTAGYGGTIATIWYPEWETIGPDGILPMPASLTESQDGHHYAVKGKKTINGKPYWIVKSWQGTAYGDHGWCYMSEDVANAVMGVRGSVALIFVHSGSRWVPQVKIMLQHPNAISYLLPLLSS